jgi:hypothetical protein
MNGSSVKPRKGAFDVNRSAIIEAATRLRRRSFRVPPFQEKRNANSDKNDSPDHDGVHVDYAHCCKQKSDASDQKKWTSDSAVKRSISKPVGEAAAGHCQRASRR